MEVCLILHSTLSGHSSDINCVKLTRNALFSASADKSIRLFVTDRKKWTECKISPFLSHTFYVNTIDVNPTESFLASGSTDGLLIIWSIATGEKLATLGHSGKSGIRFVKFSLNSQYMVSGGEDGSVCLWQCGSKWKLLQCTNEHTNCIRCCFFSPDSELLISGSSDGHIRVWDCRKLLKGETSSLLSTIDSHDLGIYCGSMSSSFNINNTTISYDFITGGADNMMHVWKIQLPRNSESKTKPSLKLIRSLKGHSRIVTCCEYSLNGLLITSVSMDHFVKIWDVTTASCLFSLEVDKSYVNTCSFSWDLKYLATGGNESSIKVYKIDIKIPSEARANTEDSKEAGFVNKSTNYSLKKNCNDRIIFPLTSIEYWTTDQIVQFISQSLQLPQYNHVWYRHGITGSVFLTLTENDLENRLEIGTLGHRRMLMKLIKELNDLVKSDMKEYQELLDEAYCPITHELMRDPVIAADGFTYERSAIEGWFQSSSEPRSPITNQLLANTNLIPNKTLRKIIVTYRNN